jgi:hypothetical protein
MVSMMRTADSKSLRSQQRAPSILDMRKVVEVTTPALRLLLWLSLSIFAAEFLIMLGLSSLSHELSDQIATILDATLLVVLVSPALRIGVKNLTVDHLGQLIGPVTVSMGIAMFPDQGTSAEELITAADEALYTAKRNGRDQIILEAADLVELSPS